MHWFNQLIDRFYDAHWQVTAGQSISYREIVGNAFGLASALFGLRRSVWAWPVGIVGNVLLFTVFIGQAAVSVSQATGTEQSGTPLYGQAARQVFFVLTSVYGWWRWKRSREPGGGPAVHPRWATTVERLVLVAGSLAAVVACFYVFRAVGAGFPVPWWYYLADSWIFVGSIAATYAMARGWVDFWLAWIAVDLVGVPELLHFRYYPSAVLYAVYAGFVIWGFAVWLRISRREGAQRRPAEPALEPA